MMTFIYGGLLIGGLLFFGWCNFHKARTDGRSLCDRMRGRLPRKHTRP